MYADITIKARCHEPAEMENLLLLHKAEYKGLDAQTDTYYETEEGRLKHRQGNIENVLIHYKRQGSAAGLKTEVLLYLKNPSPVTVEQVCGGSKVMKQIKKLRKIFFIGNVKFHLDQLEGLGHFIEIEAIDIDGGLGIAALQQQCNQYRELLQIDDEDLVNDSYFEFYS